MKMLFDIGNPCEQRIACDPVTALVVSAVAGGAQAYTSYKSAKSQKKAYQAQEAAAKSEQEKQRKFAEEQKKAEAEKLRQANARLLKGRTNKGGLLFGSEVGTDQGQPQTTSTLGAA